MLRGIRKASANWLGRIVMGVVMTLLAASFAVWGINDIFRGFGQSTLAKIGDTEIPIDQFRQTYNDRLQKVEQQLGHPLPPDQAKAIGLDRQVLSEMVLQSGLDQRARQMRLGVSNAEISRRITMDPTFQGANGQFDRARFEDVLRNAGYTEQRFVVEQRQVMLRRQLVDSVSGDIKVPKTWLDAINQFQNQERSVTYLALGAAQAGDIPQPTDDELNKYFSERKILFRAPEYRKVVAVVVTPQELAKTIEVSDDDVKKTFDQNHSRYVTPERRHVEQIVFPTMQEAQAASDRIKSGTTFAAIAAERGLKDQDVDLGSVPKSAIVDPAVAAAAFSLKQDEVSAPIQGRFGAVVVTVLGIEPEETKNLAVVAPFIRNDIALERAKNDVQSIHDKVEDDRAGGTTLEEAAQKEKLPVVTDDAVDRSGRDPSGKIITNLPHAADVVSAAFASDVGVDNDPIEADGGYIWYDVAGITPARDRTLDEVKGDVEDHWRQDQIASRLKAKAADLLDKLKTGTSFEALATANGVQVERAEGLKRGATNSNISARMTDTIFHTAKDGYANAEGDKPANWIVFQVTDVKTPAPDPNSPDGTKIDQTLKGQLGDDLFAQYTSWLEDYLGTSINQSVLAQALSNSTPDTD